MARVKIYKDTIFTLMDKKGMTHAEFNRAAGHSSSYITALYYRHPDGVVEVTLERAELWASVLGVTLSELTAVYAPLPPVTEEVVPETEEEKAGTTDDTVIGALAVLYERIDYRFDQLCSKLCDGIQAILDKMDEHWG